MALKLKAHQIEAVNKLSNGCILCGGVGSGKSLTSLTYYYMQNDGLPPEFWTDEYYPMKEKPLDLYIITTARKRDTGEWEAEMSNFLLSTDQSANHYKNKVVVDSWNNIKKYKDITGSFFIFDEQRVVGYGEWAKDFIKIAKLNQWLLLSATPGDRWEDYMAVFIANEFYKNKTDFVTQHIIWKPYNKFPQIDRYLNTGRLNRLRRKILVEMPFERSTVSNNIDIFVGYDILKYKEVIQNKKNLYETIVTVDRDGNEILRPKPIQNAPEFCQVLRRVVNENPERIAHVKDIAAKRKKIIVFYNYNFERDILLNADYGEGFEIAEWSGFKHQPIPDSDKWVYIVQYTAGAEGWNCILTDTIVFYSQNYSYRMLIQAMGRIDRLNTPFTDLYYYHIKSRSPIDISISRAVKAKKQFNESAFARSFIND